MRQLQLSDLAESKQTPGYWYHKGSADETTCPICGYNYVICHHSALEMRECLLLAEQREANARTPEPAPGLSSVVAADWFDRYLAGDKQARKEAPLARGLFGYFPNACLHVARVSFVANKQHSGDAPMQWAFNKSSDEPDCELRHMLDAQQGVGEGFDSDGLLHLAKKAWRAMADLERYLLAHYSEARPGMSVTGFQPALAELERRAVLK